MLFHPRKKRRNVFVIGLDCAAPDLVFRQYRDQLPALTGLAEQGIWGRLQSSIPAITVPAWSSMLSGRDPGELGFYGFRNRADYRYGAFSIAMGNMVKEKRVWNYLGEKGFTCLMTGIPQTFPVRPVNGLLVSGFLTPGRDSLCTYPTQFKKEMLAEIPDYEFDVKDFRTDDREQLLRRIYDMTDSHFRLTDHLLKTKTWDFFMNVEIGLDRIQHAFWHYQDPEHFRYEPGSGYEHVVRDYYRYIDAKIADWLTMLPEHTAVVVVSDHGARNMDGGICINEWLWRNGYLSFVQDPVQGSPVRFEDMEIDWDKTTAWGSGGYYGRVFLNVRGRETRGVIDPADYEKTRGELAERLAAIPDPDGNPIGTRVFRPEDVYREINNIPPDLIVYFGDLSWRSVGSLGYDGWYTRDNDTGPDSCNHDEYGIVIVSDPLLRDPGRKITGARITDIAPTILDLMGQKPPRRMQGTSLLKQHR